MIFAVYSCTETQWLWSTPSYTENITSIMFTEDASTVVVAGKQHHYIFRNQQTLTELLKWKHKDLLAFSLDKHFYLSPDNTVTGKYTVSCSCENAQAEDIDWLKTNGFKYDANNNSFSRTDAISGKVYAANNVDLSRYKTNAADYSVTVISKRPYDTLAKIAFTPVTLAIDTTNAIIYGSALIIAEPFMLINKPDNEH